ncbi:MAG: hypothetical protein ACAH11_10445 [Sphingomonas sp.]
MTSAREPRYVSFPLMAGLLLLPILFVWLLLIPGYAGSTRIAAFTYTFVPLALRLIVVGLESALA